MQNAVIIKCPTNNIYRITAIVKMETNIIYSMEIRVIRTSHYNVCKTFITDVNIQLMTFNEVDTRIY